VSGTNEDGSEFVVVSAGVPQITGPVDEPVAVPTVSMKHLGGVPYVQVHGLTGEPVLELRCVDALNLAMLLTEAAGGAQARRIDRAETHIAVFHTPNGTIGVYNP
jgi:hypothetical protein